MTPLPRKLNPDAIVEALFEIRFETTSRAVLPEVLLGRLLDNPGWVGFEHRRFPVAELPSALRAADPNLKFEPLFELKEENGARSVRIGPNVLSFHRLAPYVGWENFKPELDSLVSYLFEKSAGIQIRRLGLRYINALTSGGHNVSGLADLALEATIQGDRVTGSMNFSTNIAIGRGTTCSMRVASVDFVEGAPLPEGATCFADVDVYKTKPTETSASEVQDWIEFAHTEEKTHFFRLLRPETVQNLREE